MLKETVELELLRQKIEKAEYDAGSTSDYIDRGRPDASQLKAANETIKKNMIEAKTLKAELHELIAKSPKEAIEEWVGWHKNVLQEILVEPETNAHSKTGAFTARKTLAEWEKALRKEQDYVSINWHFLKDYKARAEKEFRRGVV